MRPIASVAPALLSIVLVAPAASQEPPSAPGRSVMEGVYTVEQAELGSEMFTEACSLCHTPSDFQNDTFESVWTGRSANALFLFMQDSLAHDDVADLEPEEYAAVVAYFFQLNGFPAAGTELPVEGPVLETISIAAPTGEPAPVLVSATPPAGASAGSPSLASGVYTEEQAERGVSVFNQVCAACHGPGEFQSADFLAAWSGRPVGSLFEFISQNMPEDAPGSLQPGEYADVLSYLLQLNGAPAGERELPPEPEALAAIPFELGASAAAGAEVRSVLLGVYTEGQADRGEEAWTGTCAACHETTDFQDEAFVAEWDGRLVSDLYGFVREFMPDDAPGSLPPQEYADILAYILRLNGAPAAGLPLPADEAMLAQLRLELGGEPGGGR